MNLEILREIDLLVTDLLKLKEVPYSGVLAELAKLLDRVEIRADIPSNHWPSFGHCKQRFQMWSTSAGTLEKIRERLTALKGILADALKVPIPITQTRFPTVKDIDLREILERDLREAEGCFAEGRWKACMVLCGSILESALYEYLRRAPAWTMIQKAVPRMKGGSPKNITSNEREEQWTLDSLVTFACENGVLDPSLKGLLDDGLREPRNLIHPAAELRKHHRVDRETADVCLATLTLALKRLSERPDPA